MTQLKFITAFDPGSNTKTFFAVLTMHDESTVLAYGAIFLCRATKQPIVD